MGGVPMTLAAPLLKLAPQDLKADSAQQTLMKTGSLAPSYLVIIMMLHMGVPLHHQWQQKECSIVKPSWQMDQSPTPKSQQGS
jgi:hypothetical protein